MWLTQQQIAKLFNRNKSVISRHINSILKNELEKETTVALFATVQKEGKRKVIRKVEHYNLDVIISVGYKVNSKQGVIFRRWATKILKDYLINNTLVSITLLIANSNPKDKEILIDLIINLLN